MLGRSDTMLISPVRLLLPQIPQKLAEIRQMLPKLLVLSRKHVDLLGLPLSLLTSLPAQLPLPKKGPSQSALKNANRSFPQSQTRRARLQ